MGKKHALYAPLALARIRAAKAAYGRRHNVAMRKAGLCVDCKKPSVGWRCPEHAERVNRYRRHARFKKWLEEQREADQGSR